MSLVVKNPNAKITEVKGFQILDSRNNPTVACRISVGSKSVTFKVPSGASTGEKEAVELRDSDKWSVTQAAKNIEFMKAALRMEGMPLSVSQSTMDDNLIGIDGTPNKGKYGANAILAISGAYAMAQAAFRYEVPLFRLFAGDGKLMLPVPQFNVLNAGKHADSGFEIQETMILPAGAKTFGEAYIMGSKTRKALGAILKKLGHSTGRGDEGGFVNPFKTADDTVKAVLDAISNAGFVPGKDIFIGFDGAFSEIFGKDLMDKKANPRDFTYHFGGKRKVPSQVAEMWAGLVQKYPIISIEDGLAENDTAGWQILTGLVGNRVQLVLDDYICTNINEIRRAIGESVGNSSLIKLNQIGTLTETLEAMQATSDAGRTNVISHRSGETEDSFIGHFALHPLVSQIKSGSSGSDRNAKYNEIWMIEQEFPGATYRGMAAFSKSVQEHWQGKAQ